MHFSLLMVYFAKCWEIHLLTFFLLFVLAASPLKVTAELLCRLMDPDDPMQGKRLSLQSVLRDMKYRH